MLIGLLFATARKRNGLAGIHDLASRTRVVQQPRMELRPALPTAEVQPVAESESMLRIGAYHVLETLEQGEDDRWLLAYDARLLRKIWVHIVPKGTPEVDGYLRSLRRIGRLRWLAGRRSEGENWDAFEAPDGTPLLELIRQPQSWESVRFWLLDLAGELAVALEGRPDRPTEDPVAAPIPLHARRILEDKSVLSSPEEAGRALKRLLLKPTRVTRARRLAIVVGCLVFPLISVFSAVLAFSLYAKTARENPELRELSQLVSHRQTSKSMKMLGINIPNLPDDRFFKIYIARRYRDVVENQEVWNSFQGFILVRGSNRAFVEQSIRDYPNPSDEEFAEAEAAMEAVRLGTIKENVKEAGSIFDQTEVYFAIIGACLLFYLAIPAMIAALCFRGGLVLFISGAAVVRKDGSRASRFRIFWRSLVTWTALSIPAVLVAIPLSLAPPVVAVFLTSLIVGGLAAWSALMPDRGIPDRLSGTCLVAR